MSCPHNSIASVVLSQNHDYWNNIKINQYAPSANLGPITKPGQSSNAQRLIGWFSADTNLTEYANFRWTRFNNESSRVLHTGGTKYRKAVYQAAAQLLDLQANDLATNFPEIYQINHDSLLGRTIVNKTTKNIFPINPNNSYLHPLVISGLLSQEDICIVKETKKGRHLMIGGFLATPTEWELDTFIGSDMDEIHQRVSGYHSLVDESPVKVLLKDTVDKALQSLPEYPIRQIMRNNLFLKKNGSLALLPNEKSTIKTKDITQPGAQIFLRSERETLTRLPSTEQYPEGNRYIIFTILANVINLSQAASSPRREEFIAALQTNHVLNKDKRLAKIAIDFLKTF